MTGDREKDEEEFGRDLKTGGGRDNTEGGGKTGGKDVNR